MRSHLLKQLEIRQDKGELLWQVCYWLPGPVLDFSSIFPFEEYISSPDILYILNMIQEKLLKFFPSILNFKIAHLHQHPGDYNEYPQEVPFPILPWSVGTSPQPDRHGGVQLCHGDHHQDEDYGRDDDSGEQDDHDYEHYHSLIAPW